MTTKKTLKKLTLKKESIANLNNAELNQLKGGATTTITVSSHVCTGYLTNTIGITIGLYGVMSETRSLYPNDCPDPPVVDTDIPVPDYDSQWIVNDGCLLTDVNIYG